MNEYLLTSDVDKYGEQYNVKYTTKVKNSPLKEFANIGWVELCKTNQINSLIALSVLLDNQAVYLEVNKNIVACCCFNFLFEDRFSIEHLSKTEPITNINLTFTKENYRRKGLATLLFKYVEKISKTHQSSVIKSYVHANNFEQQKVCEAQGRQVVWYVYEKNLK